MGSSLSRSYVEEAHPGVTRATARNTRRNSTEAHSYDAVERLSRLEILLDELSAACDHDKTIMKDERIRIGKLKNEILSGNKIDVVTIRDLQREVVRRVAEAWGEREVSKVVEARQHEAEAREHNSESRGNEAGGSAAASGSEISNYDNEYSEYVYDNDDEKYRGEEDVDWREDYGGSSWWEDDTGDRPRSGASGGASGMDRVRLSLDKRPEPSQFKARRAKSVNFDERVIVRRLPPSPNLEGSSEDDRALLESGDAEVTALDLVPPGSCPEYDSENEQDVEEGRSSSATDGSGTSSSLRTLSPYQQVQADSSDPRSHCSDGDQKAENQTAGESNEGWEQEDYRWISREKVGETDGEDTESAVVLQDRAECERKPWKEAKVTGEHKSGKKSNKTTGASWGEGREKRVERLPKRERGLRKERESGRIGSRKTWTKSRHSLDLKDDPKEYKVKGKKKNSFMRGLGNVKRAVLLLPPSAAEAKPVKLKTKYGKKRKQKETQYSADDGTTSLLASKIGQELWHFTSTNQQPRGDNDPENF